MKENSIHAQGGQIAAARTRQHEGDIRRAVGGGNKQKHKAKSKKKERGQK